MIQTTLQLLDQEHTVNIVWIPAHVGIDGNETVDTLAKQAATIQDRLALKLPYTDYIPTIKEKMKEDRQALWNTTTTQLHTIKPKIDRPWFHQLGNRSRSFITTLSRLRTGHSCLPVHLHRLRIIDSPLCRCQNENGDLDHLLFQCNHPVTESRSELIKEIEKLKIQNPTGLKLLKTNNVKIYTCIHNILKDNHFEV